MPAAAHHHGIRAAGRNCLPFSQPLQPRGRPYALCGLPGPPPAPTPLGGLHHGAGAPPKPQCHRSRLGWCWASRVGAAGCQPSGANPALVVAPVALWGAEPGPGPQAGGHVPQMGQHGSQGHSNHLPSAGAPPVPCSAQGPLCKVTSGDPLSPHSRECQQGDAATFGSAGAVEGDMNHSQSSSVESRLVGSALGPLPTASKGDTAGWLCPFSHCRTPGDTVAWPWDGEQGVGGLRAGPGAPAGGGCSAHLSLGISLPGPGAMPPVLPRGRGSCGASEAF